MLDILRLAVPAIACHFCRWCATTLFASVRESKVAAGDGGLPQGLQAGSVSVLGAQVTFDWFQSCLESFWPAPVWWNGSLTHSFAIADILSDLATFNKFFLPLS